MPFTFDSQELCQDCLGDGYKVTRPARRGDAEETAQCRTCDGTGLNDKARIRKLECTVAWLIKVLVNDPRQRSLDDAVGAFHIEQEALNAAPF